MLSTIPRSKHHSVVQPGQKLTNACFNHVRSKHTNVKRAVQASHNSRVKNSQEAEKDENFQNLYASARTKAFSGKPSHLAPKIAAAALSVAVLVNLALPGRAFAAIQTQNSMHGPGPRPTPLAWIRGTRDTGTAPSTQVAKGDEDLREGHSSVTPTSALSDDAVGIGGGQGASGRLHPESEAAEPTAEELKAYEESARRRARRLQPRDLEELLRIPKNAASRAWKAERQLGKLSVGDVEDHLFELAWHFGTPAITALAAKEPRLLTVSAPELTRRFEDLRAALSLPAALALQFVDSTPSLLLVQRDVMAARLAQLGAMFNVPPHLLPSLCLIEPDLLLEDTRVLESRRTHLLSCLEMRGGSEELATLLRRVPSLLLWETKRVDAKLAELRKLLGLPKREVLTPLLMRHPRLLVLPRAYVDRNMKDLRKLLQATAREAQILCVDEPTLLDTTYEEASDRFLKLVQLFDLPVPQLRTAILKKPLLLARPPEAMAAAHRAAATAMDRRSGEENGALE